jgi:myo-inositol catabolism protein IolS
MSDRRSVLLGLGAVAAAAGAGAVWRLKMGSTNDGPAGLPAVLDMKDGMPYRAFGRTGLQISELAFGAWGIGGQSYGPVQKGEALDALARAEELGCNLVDTAAVYGDSEAILGEFLSSRRSRWVLSTKYSGQAAGLRATVEEQLRRLQTDYIDFYMIHWLPRGDEARLLDELRELKREGKVRFTGVSLYNTSDIDHVIKHTDLDGIMVPLNLLEPYPFISRRAQIAASGIGVLVRSALKEGFLAGRFTRETRFTDPTDQRSQLSVEELVQTIDRVERFRFLEQLAGSMARGAIGYPLSMPEASSVVVGVKNVWEAEENFGRTAGFRLDADTLKRIDSIQRDIGLKMGPSLRERLRALLP